MVGIGREEQAILSIEALLVARVPPRLGRRAGLQGVGTYSRGMTPRVMEGLSCRGYADLTHDGTRHMTRRSWVPSTID